MILYDRTERGLPERHARRLVLFHGSVDAALAAHDRFPSSTLGRTAPRSHSPPRAEIRAPLIASKERYP